LHELSIGESGRALRVGRSQPLAFLAGPRERASPEPVSPELGPRQRVSRDGLRAVADRLKTLGGKLGMGVVLQTSCGEPLDAGLGVLDALRREHDLLVCSEVQRADDLLAAAEVLDLIRIPAYLWQHPDALPVLARCPKPLCLELRPLLGPEAARSPLRALTARGGTELLLAGSGASFGYNQRVADMTQIQALQALGHPVLFDASRALGDAAAPPKRLCGGAPVATLVRAATAAGANAICVELHPDPGHPLGPSDHPYPLLGLEDLMRDARDLSALHRARSDA
jgi:2-dehydro-3-deoxyphosphooctonate aldolase (KDO 8-P synthase)